MKTRETPFQRALKGYRKSRPRFGSAGEAYSQGYSGMHCKWPHGTFSRAAWMAGAMNRKADNAQSVSPTETTARQGEVEGASKPKQP